MRKQQRGVTTRAKAASTMTMRRLGEMVDNVIVDRGV
jgi:hypothetical protein